MSVSAIVPQAPIRQEGPGVADSRTPAARAILLPAVEQRISGDDELRYLGGRFCASASPPVSTELVRRTLAAVGAEAGWIGIDFILAGDPPPAAGAAPTTGHALVVDVNPRLTTSYVLYRAATDRNLSALLIGDSNAPVSDWRAGRFECNTQGRIGHTEKP